MAFIQGFLASLELDGNVITLVTADVTLDESKTTLDKSVMDGTGQSSSIPGKKSGTLSINGHIDQANLALLEGSWEKDQPVPFVLTIEEGAGTSDSNWTGTMTLTAFSKSTAADGNWEFSMSGETTYLKFTAMVP